MGRRHQKICRHCNFFYRLYYWYGVHFIILVFGLFPSSGVTAMVLNISPPFCSVQYTFNPTLSIYLLHESFHLGVCLPIRVFTGRAYWCNLACVFFSFSPHVRTIRDIHITSKENMANEFNTFFTNVGPNLANDITEPDENISIII